MSTGQALSGYLHVWAGEFLRALRLYEEGTKSADTAETAAEAARRLRRAARRLGGTLHTFRPLLDAAWAGRLCGELRWLSAALSREFAYGARLARLEAALSRLGGECGSVPEGGAESGPGGPSGAEQRRPAGTARAGALLERQLTQARVRAHSAALDALVSGRCHAVADEVALLASEVTPAGSAARRTAAVALGPHADRARARLEEAVRGLPLPPAGAYPEGCGLAAPPAAARGPRLHADAGWHGVRRMLREYRYAEELLLAAGAECGTETGAAAAAMNGGGARPEAEAVRRDLAAASAVLSEHRDAVAAAEAAAGAARTARIAPSTAYALGVLHADQRQHGDAAQAAFARMWRSR